MILRLGELVKRIEAIHDTAFSSLSTAFDAYGIDSVKEVEKVTYTSRYAITEGKGKFTVEEEVWHISACDIIDEITVIGNLTQVRDHFKCNLNYELKTYSDMKRLNNEIRETVALYVELFEEDNKKVLPFVQTFARNMLVINNNLKNVQNSLVNDPYRQNELNEALANLNETCNGFHVHNNILFEPPVAPFAQKLKLTGEQFKILKSWLPPSTKSQVVLYQMSVHGNSPAAFHSACDNKGPTVTIYITNNGYIFGGYSSASWSSVNGYVASPGAFLFTIINPHNIPPTKFDMNPAGAMNAIYCNVNYHPSWGGNHDISAYALNTTGGGGMYTSIGATYNDTTGKGTAVFTGDRANFWYTDIIVLTWQI